MCLPVMNNEYKEFDLSDLLEKLKKLGLDKSDPYIKSNNLYTKVLNFELWFS